MTVRSSTGNTIALALVCLTLACQRQAEPPAGTSAVQRTARDVGQREQLTIVSWPSVDGATAYRVQIGRDSASFAHEQVVLDTLVTGVTMALPASAADGEYYYRTLALEAFAGGWRPGRLGWSNPTGIVFQAWAPPVPILVDERPETDTTTAVGSSCMELESMAWRPSPGATRYQVQLAYDLSFSDPSINAIVLAPDTTYQYDLSVILAAPAVNLWRVRAGTRWAWSLWSEVGSMWGHNVPLPDEPIALTAPPNGADVDWPPMLSWEDPRPSLMTYRLLVDDDANFSSPEIDANLSVGGYDASELPTGRTYHWRIASAEFPACGQALPLGETWSFALHCTPVAPAILWQPADNSALVSVPATLQWYLVPGASEYQVQLDTDPSFASPDVDDVTESYSLTAENLAPGSTYHWRVRASNGCQFGDWSPVWQFTSCAALATASLVSPAEDGFADVPAALSWIGSSTATRYRVQVDETSDFASPVVDDETVTPGYSAGGLDTGRDYYWRVRAFNDCEWGDWSTVWGFRTCAPVTAPTIESPDDGARVSATPPLDWMEVPGAVTYQLQVDTDADFGSPVMDVRLEATEFTDYSTMDWPSRLNWGTTHVWRVRAHNGCAWGAWSAPRTFETEYERPILEVPEDDAAAVAQPITFEWRYWSAEAVATSYQFTIWDELGAIVVQRPPDTTQTVVSGLDHGTRYYWQVTAVNLVQDESGLTACIPPAMMTGCLTEYAYSYTWAFTTVCPVPPSPMPIAPPDDAAGVGVPVIVDWEDVEGATRYRLQIAQSSAFDDAAMDVDVERLESDYFTSAVTAGVEYFWRVQAFVDCGWSDWSSPRSFTP
jgi:hypothetical protein